ncbi:MAG: phospho-N-acetylmuramoyl-pentapeptide-transferase [Candidatus Parcubacteria bacterium]|nr:MAG: phospho-N-acetylmuramoyl-pentapeptide-transferase [Candidatus Parcubacteria bacterium]
METNIALNIIKLFFLALISFLTTLKFVPLYLKIALKFNLVNKSKAKTVIFNQINKEKEGTPTMGGVLLWLPTIILAFTFYYLSQYISFFAFLNFLDRRETYLPLAALFLGGFFGLLDDIARHVNQFGLKKRDILIVYFSIALLFAWWFVSKLNFNFIDFVDYRFLVGTVAFLFFFIFVFLATVLSVDITDGVDGLLGGLSFMIILTLVVFAFINGDYNLSSFGASLLGSIIAYLWFNFYPAKFFDGNTGSFAIGSVIAIMSFFTNSILLLPLFGLVFVIEALSVILQVSSKKFFNRKIFHIAPLHHHLKFKGWNEALITFRLWIVNAIGVSLAIIVYIFMKLI